MKMKMKMKHKLAALSLTVVMAAALTVSSEAREFIVGGNDGWTEIPSESFDQWARRNRFQMNDSLGDRYLFPLLSSLRLWRR